MPRPFTSVRGRQESIRIDSRSNGLVFVRWRGSQAKRTAALVDRQVDEMPTIQSGLLLFAGECLGGADAVVQMRPGRNHRGAGGFGFRSQCTFRNTRQRAHKSANKWPPVTSGSPSSHVGGLAAAYGRCIISAAPVRLTFARNRESAVGVFRWSTCVRTKEIVEGLQNSLYLLSQLAPRGVSPEPLASAGKWRRHFQSCQWSLPNESLLFARDSHCVQAD